MCFSYKNIDGLRIQICSGRLDSDPIALSALFAQVSQESMEGLLGLWQSVEREVELDSRADFDAC